MKCVIGSRRYSAIVVTTIKFEHDPVSSAAYDAANDTVWAGILVMLCKGSSTCPDHCEEWAVSLLL